MGGEKKNNFKEHEISQAPLSIRNVSWTFVRNFYSPPKGKKVSVNHGHATCYIITREFVIKLIQDTDKNWHNFSAAFKKNT